ncbi:enoyl-CoA hydratase/isomerase family protein [Salirhabdus salicampi]|uniref:enoyl-CoA hydratase/isomerase family protein n=1 Tax=Salirhabdus salicampi TaxID=476102 RepID=UPI0020C464B3|nr:enoyl-CoA hydratase/isomerase family protein [Salirhabdus salicampi]
MFHTITYERNESGFSIITLNRPHKRNAITTEMCEELNLALDLARSDNVKFLVITGSGVQSFSAGGDLRQFHGNMTNEEAYDLLNKLSTLLLRIVEFPVPTVALLNGSARGGGCEIASACDFRFAKAGTEFGYVQGNIGVSPGWGGGALLYRRTNSSFAHYWIASSEMFPAVTLQQQGWVQHIVREREWGNYDLIFSSFIKKTRKQMIIFKKQLLYYLNIFKLRKEMEEEVKNCSSLWDTPEHIDAVASFFQQKGKK